MVIIDDNQSPAFGHDEGTGSLYFTTRISNVFYYMINLHFKNFNWELQKKYFFLFFGGL